jgi:peptide/nickel transport system substrate-binding protein
MRRLRLVSGSLVAVALALFVAACGDTKSSGTGSSAGAAASGYADVRPSEDQQRGGTLKVVSSDAWAHLDPGQAYYQVDYLVVYATQRPLYSFTPTSPRTPVPDLASGAPKVSADGKTVTVRIKPNVRWSPPLHRAVTSADVRYAIERTFNPNVPSSYASIYYPIVGAGTAKGGPISGIETPDRTTIVFHLTKDYGATFARALTLPGSAPVPEEVARKYDSKSPTTYDSDPTKQVFSGPYMIKSYQAGRSLTLVRNPNWIAKTDFRPAHVDRIVWKAGGEPNVLARQVLAGSDQLMVDVPPSAVLKRAYEKQRSQLSLSPLGMYYVTLNTATKPFDDVNLRRAVAAATDRRGYLLARGGTLVGQVATHFVGPEVGGYEQGGGAAGFGFDFLRNPGGDMAVARKYMKLAGYPSGRYTGNAKLLVVGFRDDPGPQETQIVQAALSALGFKTTLKLVSEDALYTKYCTVPKAKVSVCATAGWNEDFPDPYAALYLPFNGAAIQPSNNANWAELDDPAINAAMNRATTIADGPARLKAWARVDRMITDTAAAIPMVWASNAHLQGSKVHGVIDPWNADWNLSYSSVR